MADLGADEPGAQQLHPPAGASAEDSRPNLIKRAADASTADASPSKRSRGGGGSSQQSPGGASQGASSGGALHTPEPGATPEGRARSNAGSSSGGDMCHGLLSGSAGSCVGLILLPKACESDALSCAQPRVATPVIGQEIPTFAQSEVGCTLDPGHDPGCFEYLLIMFYWVVWFA